MVPWNYILLFSFAVCSSYAISYSTAYNDWEHLVIAGGMTLGMFIGLTVYACVTKEDFTIKYGLLCCCFFTVIGGVILMIIIRSYWLTFVFAFVVIMVYSVYIIYDTQLIVGKHSHKYSIDDYIMAAFQLY